MKNIILKLKDMKEASRQLRVLSSLEKNKVLENLATLLLEQQGSILAANQLDLVEYKKSNNFQYAFEDRLRLTAARLDYMRDSLLSVATLSDPVGLVTEEKELANGLSLKKIQGPLGLIFMIFESRPNVVTEAFSLAFKSGNAIILKGGKESDHTSAILYKLIETALDKNKISKNVLWGLVGASRADTDILIKQHRFIDVLIPRGGDTLIEYVTQHSTIPLIKNDRGLCHIYVAAEADQQMALEIVDNAKTQRPGVCNAAETVLVDAKIAVDFLPLLYARLHAKQVEIFACEKSLSILPKDGEVSAATDSSYGTEYLDLKINIKIVNGLDQALDHIETYGSHHSECIITANQKIADRFQNEVDAAAVYWNASTRFTDGYEFGLGGEIGISTQKLHVRGPVGLMSLTSGRWVIKGNGQIRG
jgi:glutamate-5-semialdehyde dehydrogenase